MSPSRFANLRGSEEWLPADVCRSARKMAIARLLDRTPAQHSPHERRQQPARSEPGQRPSCAPVDFPAQATMPGRGRRRAAEKGSETSAAR